MSKREKTNFSTNHDDLRGSTRIMYDELCAQGVSVQIVSAPSSILRYRDIRGDSHFLFSTSSDKSSAAGLMIAKNKSRSAVVTSELGIPTPDDLLCYSFPQALEFFVTHRKLVLKPAANSGGKGVSTGLTNIVDLKRAYKFAKTYGPEVVVQQHLEGDDVRLLVVGGSFVSAVRREPAQVVGDGTSSIKTLISLENASSNRNDSSLSSLLHIDTTAAKRFLGETVNQVPNRGQKVRVVGPANVSLGGSMSEATHLVSAEMIHAAELITNTLKLGICGVDMIWNRSDNTYGVIEVNAIPGIDIHNDPFSGTSSDAALRYAEWLVA